MDTRATPALTLSATNYSFGYWVRRRRLALDMTQADLARAVNCARVTIAKIERDERRPSRQMANLLADSLAIPADHRDRFLAAALGKWGVERLAMAAQPLAEELPAREHVPPSNLPTPSTPFVGRKSELDQLRLRLEEPACRLLTLLGPGGFGKTRLAIGLGALAVERPDLFPDGVFFVALDGLESAQLVVPTIAAALDFTFYEQQGQETQLLSYLEHKRLLLILDSAEQILDADFVVRILTYAPDSKVLVTTREALNLQQEWLQPVGGMSIDLVEDAEAGGLHTTVTDAVALFQQCAQRVHPNFDLVHELVHVQRICRLVDGAPLAIELAAAWLKALPCEQVARELARNIDLLATTVRNIPARHRNMRAVLEQSWHYLTDEEQQVFRRLSVFEGGFRPHAAEVIANTSVWILAVLVEKSMLYLEKSGRFRIHALLRQLGAQKLANHAEELARCQARHSEYFMTFLADRRSSIVGPQQLVALREVQDEFDNIRASWLYVTHFGRLTDLGPALLCLFRFLWMRGRFEEGERLATQALEATTASALTDEDQIVRVALLAYFAQFTTTLGNYDQALASSHVALEEAVQAGDLRGQAHCHYVVGLVEGGLGNGDRAIGHLLSAYQIYHELNDVLGRADTALRLAQSHFSLKSQYNLASSLAEEGLQLYRALGDRFDMADALNMTAWLRWMAGNPDQAEILYQECLEVALAIGNRMVAALTHGGLAMVASAREQWNLAISLMQHRIVQMQILGFDSEIKHGLNFLCGIYASAGRYTDAIALLNTNPEMWRTPWTAQAQIGAGAFQEVMAYLPQETAQKLAIDHAYDISLYLVAWAMLLNSNCALKRVDHASTDRTLVREEREMLAFEILSAVQSSEPRDPARRTQVDRLLANLREKAGSAVSDYDTRRQKVRSIPALAQEMLTIQLG